MAAESPGDAWGAIWEENVWADTVWEGGPSGGGVGPPGLPTWTGGTVDLLRLKRRREGTK